MRPISSAIDLPSGFDVVREFDVNAHSEELSNNVWGSLNPGGRFVLVDQFARLHWAFAGSLIDPDFAFPTVAQIKDLLEEVGFRQISDNPLAEILNHAGGSPSAWW